MRRFIQIVLILIFVPVGLAFTVLNSQPALLDVYIAKFELPVAVIVLLALFVGALLGIFSDYFARMRYRSEVRGLRRKLTAAEQAAAPPAEGPP